MTRSNRDQRDAELAAVLADAVRAGRIQAADALRVLRHEMRRRNTNLKAALPHRSAGAQAVIEEYAGRGEAPPKNGSDDALHADHVYELGVEQMLQTVTVATCAFVAGREPRLHERVAVGLSVSLSRTCGGRMDPNTIALILRSGLPLAERLGLFQSAVVRALADLQTDLRNLIEAPVHEGLRRLAYAEAAVNDDDRAALLREARSKFDDAAARSLDPIQHGWAVLLAAGTWALLGSEDLAAKAGAESLIAADEALNAAYADILWGPVRPFWAPDPEPACAAAWELARVAVQFNLNLGFPFAPEQREGDTEPYYYLEPGGSDADFLMWVSPEFVEDERSRFMSSCRRALPPSEVLHPAT
ncbi:MAG: hypothetical protein ABR616_18865 [Dermatophilaceae bacterium]